MTRRRSGSSCAASCRGLGHEVTVCQDGRAALKVLEKSSFDAAILDLRMPGLSGIEVLEHLKRVSPDTEAVVMTGHASIETATMAMRLGAADYMTKPCKLADIEAVLTRVAAARELKHKNLALESRVQKAEGPSILVGDSQPMQDVHRFLSMVAPTEATVLILGETGSGKELAARTSVAVEQAGRPCPSSPSTAAPSPSTWSRASCSAIAAAASPAPTATTRASSRWPTAAPCSWTNWAICRSNVQVKLLRFLESKEIRRVGESEPFRTDVRVLCATNRDLRQMIREDQFREDLYFRINTFEIRLPPLARAQGRHPRPGDAPSGPRRPAAFRAGGGSADAGSGQGAARARLVG